MLPVLAGSISDPDRRSQHSGQLSQTLTAMEQIDQNDDEGSDNTTITLKKKPQCQVEGCTADLACEKAYCIKRRLCNEHMRADAVCCWGQPGLWRFCFQCGKLEPLSRFEGNKRSCRTRLAQRKQRETRRSSSDLAYRCNRGNTKQPSLAPTSRCSKPISKAAAAATQICSLLQDMQEELHSCLQQHQQQDDVVPPGVAAKAAIKQTTSMLQLQQAQYSCPLPTVTESEAYAPLAGIPHTVGLPTDLVAGYSNCSGGQYSMPLGQQSSSSSLPYLPRVPEYAAAAAANDDAAPLYMTDLCDSPHAQPSYQQRQQQQQQTAPQAPRHVSFAVQPPPAAATTCVLPTFHSSGAQQQLSPMSGAVGGCQSAPLPTVSGLSGMSIKGATSASPPPTATAPAGAKGQAPHAQAYYSQMLDDLMVEVKSNVSRGAAAGVMRLEDLTAEDLLHQHSDADLKQMLESALVQAAEGKLPPLRQQKQQQLLNAAAAAVGHPMARLLADGSNPQQKMRGPQGWNQMQMMPPAMPPSTADANYNMAMTGFELEQPLLLQAGTMRSSSPNAQGFGAPVAGDSSTTLLPTMNLDHLGSAAAAAAVGSYPLPAPAFRPAAATRGGMFNIMGGPTAAPAPVAPTSQQQQQALVNSSMDKLQRIRQQQMLLQQMHNQVLAAHAAASSRSTMASDVTAAAQRAGNLGQADLVKPQAQGSHLDKQLDDMQEIINFLQMEMMDLDPVATMCG